MSEYPDIMPEYGQISAAELDELRSLIGEDAYWRLRGQKGYYEKPYRIALRDDDQGYLDDVVVNDVECFRLERMDDGYFWAACYLKGHERLSFRISGGRRSKSMPMPCMVDVEEFPTDVRYEGWKDSRHP